MYTGKVPIALSRVTELAAFRDIRPRFAFREITLPAMSGIVPHHGIRQTLTIDGDCDLHEAPVTVQA
jgi:hypothetical protein